MKLLILLAFVSSFLESSFVNADDDKGQGLQFERGAGMANNLMAAGSAAYNAPPTPMPKYNAQLPAYVQQQMNQQFPGSLQFPPGSGSVQGGQYPGLGSNQGNQYQGGLAGSTSNQGNQYQGLPPNQGNQYQNVPNNQGNQYQANPYLGTTSTPAPLMLQIYDNKPNNDYKPEMKYNVQGLQAPPQLTQIQSALTSLEAVRQSLMAMAVQGSYQTCSDNDPCDLAKWKKCTCITPAAYDNEGRGNCNLGATKLDTKVWCYVDPRQGDAKLLCPDAQPSPTKPGYFWSRFACIT
jgi:hypothetical protein